MAKLSWCMLLVVVIACQVHDAASELTVTPSTSVVSVAKDIAVGTALVTVSSTGTDIKYSLESQQPDTTSKIFAIGETSGVVTVADKTELDFDTVKTYTLVIKATQGTTDSTDSGTTTVKITVNKAPRFAEDRYAACVNKSSLGGTIVIQVTATDEDAGDTLTYSITDDSIFEIESSTGTIKVKSDQTIAETPVSYNLILTATDNDETTPLTGTTTVSISVDDPCPVVIPPNYATTITVSFGLFLVSGAVHLLGIW